MPRLLVENGVDRGKSYVVQKDGSFFAGRDKAAQVQIHDEMGSRRHFQIENKGGQYYIRDLQSANGTFLNGSLVRKVELLAPNDRIQVGSTLISFQDDKPHPLIGREISGYRILDRVGRGGMGTVYRALQTSLDRIVALKVLAPHLVQNTNFVNLFIREARAAGSLSHPNIVQVYDVGVHGDVYFFSMEYIPDGSVEDLLNRNGPIPLARALQLVHDAARGLEYAERLGIVHRDIKPGNLMVGTGGVVKIGDLGISRSTDGEGQASQKDGVSGSPHYIAPEQARGDDIDSRSDVYSLGVSLYQCLSGRTPFRGATPREVILKHLKETPPPLSDLVENLPGDVAALVEHMMAKKVDERVKSAGDLLEELSPLLRKYPIDGAGNPGVDKGLRLKRVVLGLVGAVVLTGAGFGAMSWYQQRQDNEKERQEALSGFERELKRAESQLEESQLEEARATLEALAAADLSEELTAERNRLIARAAEIENQLAETARGESAKAASRALSKQIENAFPSENAPWEERVRASRSAAEQWRALATKFSETTTAKQCRTNAASLETAAGELEGREVSARNELQSILSSYEREFEKGRFRGALGILEEFREERHDGTTAHRDWIDAKRALQAREESAFDSLSRRVEALAADGQLRSAEVELKTFLADVAFDPTRQRVQAALDKIEKALTQGQDGDPDPDARPDRALGTALTTALATWSASLETDLAMTQLSRAKLSLNLTPSRSTELNEFLEWMRTWDGGVVGVNVFTQIRARGPKLAEFPLYVKSETEARTAELVDVQEKRVVYRIDDQIYPTGWEDLSARGRAEIFVRIAKTPEEYLFAGLLAHVGGMTAERDRLWDEAVSADPALSARRDLLLAFTRLTRADR